MDAFVTILIMMFGFALFLIVYEAGHEHFEKKRVEKKTYSVDAQETNEEVYDWRKEAPNDFE